MPCLWIRENASARPSYSPERATNRTNGARVGTLEKIQTKKKFLSAARGTKKKPYISSISQRQMIAKSAKYLRLGTRRTQASLLFASFGAATLPFLVRMPCPFWCKQIRKNPQKDRENRGFLHQVRRQYYVLLAHPLLDYITRLQTNVVSYSHLALSCSFSKLLTHPLFLPYNMLAFDLLGLIRCLERMLSGSVPSPLILLESRHLLSLEMGTAVGVVGLSAVLNGVSIGYIRVLTQKANKSISN